MKIAPGAIGFWVRCGSVHRVRHADAVPVDGGLLVQLVLDHDAQPFALAGADFRARHRAIVGPDGGFGMAAPDERCTPGRGGEAVFPHGRRARRNAGEGRRGQRGGARQEE